MSDNDEQMSTNADKDEVEAKDGSSTPKDVVMKVNKTKRQLTYDAKQEAIEKFKRGELDDMYRVVHMSNGKYRCYKRKEPLAPTPINVNQAAANNPGKQIIIEDDDDEEPVVVKKGKHKADHDPMQDVMYYNLNNQINEQLNKRLDSINQEIERLRNKNSKLKNKYKNLKQAIFVTEEEEQHEPPAPQPKQEEQQQPEVPRATIIPIHQRRRTGIDFNQFF